ncbi:MAG: DUF1145 domain-containing protein [Porticoccaceae bacterium]|nr:DUF1145 domain-containing protein [Porticoccaceae bacterium]
MIVFWLLFAINLLAPFDGTFGQGVFWTGVVMFVLHIVEVVFVYAKLNAIGRGELKDVLSVLAFGILFWKPLLSK